MLLNNEFFYLAVFLRVHFILSYFRLCNGFAPNMRHAIVWNNGPVSITHPVHPINSSSRKKRQNLWVGQCVSSWWPLFPSRNFCVNIYLSIRMHSLYELWLQDVCILTQGGSFSIGEAVPHQSLKDCFGECAVPVLIATCHFLWFHQLFLTLW